MQTRIYGEYIARNAMDLVCSIEIQGYCPTKNAFTVIDLDDEVQAPFELYYREVIFNFDDDTDFDVQKRLINGIIQAHVTNDYWSFV